MNEVSKQFQLLDQMEKDWTDDEMLSAGFPKFVTNPDDRDRLAAAAPTELAAWRQAVATHRSLTSVNQKLANRLKLEAAFVALKRAYEQMRQGTLKTLYNRVVSKLGPVNRLRRK